MKKKRERIESLLRQGEAQRRLLAEAVEEVREDVEQRRMQWRIAGWVAGGLAAAVTAAYKLFGKRSLAAQIGRYSSVASLLLGLGRAALRLRRFL